jgi:hypothetical protein
MATGNSVVTTNLPETKCDGVYWAENDDQYIKYMGEALTEKESHHNYLRKLRKEVANNGSWKNNVEPLLEELQRWENE